uniref:Polynucleotide adenylyltransferase n=1 Tax=Echinostoma caproni TaxID=27848 RepID=A0A183AWA0_9TREM
LGLGSQSSDMDAVLLVPRFMDRDDYFSSFLDLLQNHKKISDILAITETLVPLIRMRINGIQVDLSLSIFGSPGIPLALDLDMPPSDLYCNMDSTSIHSLSGAVLAYIFRQYLDQDPNYHWLLRAIRRWIRARNISGYIFGFPPTVSWTVLVIYLCKQITNSSSFICDASVKEASLEVVFYGLSIYPDQLQFPDQEKDEFYYKLTELIRLSRSSDIVLLAQVGKLRSTDQDSGRHRFFRQVSEYYPNKGTE